MRVLGLDPGLRRTGWGVIDAEGSRLRHVANGAIATGDDDAIGVRLARLYEALDAIIAEHRPDMAAVEETFVNVNARSTLKLGLARGIAIVVPARHGLDVTEYATNAVKKSVVGVGHADKNQIQMMVRRILPGVTIDGADSADALAVAICHAHHAATRRVWAAERRRA
jgi:crossover junction endodeoxyribonuclease RuvC